MCSQQLLAYLKVSKRARPLDLTSFALTCLPDQDTQPDAEASALSVRVLFNRTSRDEELAVAMNATVRCIEKQETHGNVLRYIYQVETSRVDLRIILLSMTMLGILSSLQNALVILLLLPEPYLYPVNLDARRKLGQTT